MRAEEMSGSQVAGFCFSGLTGGVIAGGATYLTLLVAGKTFGKPSWYASQSALPITLAGAGLGGLTGFTIFGIYDALVLNPSPELQEARAGVRRAERKLEDIRLVGRAQQLDLDAIRECGLRGLEIHPVYVTSSIHDGNLEALGALLDAGCRYSGSVHELINKPDALRVLLEHAPATEVDPLDHRGRTPLQRAITLDYRDSVELLLEHGADPLKAGEDGEYPLHTAAIGDSAILSAVLEHVDEVDRSDKDGQTALYKACRWGCIENARLLIEKGADPSNIKKTDIQLMTAPIRALLQGDDADDTAAVVTPQQFLDLVVAGDVQAVINALRDKSLDPSERVGPTTALHTSVESKNLVMLMALLPRCKDVNVRDAEGRLALEKAFFRNDIAACRLLRGRGAEPKLPLSTYSPLQTTLLHLAASATDPERLDALLGGVGDVDPMDAHGLTPAHLPASASANRLGHLQILLEHGSRLTRSGIPEEEWQGMSPEVQSLIETRG